jgi:hypothetical protein
LIDLALLIGSGILFLAIAALLAAQAVSVFVSARRARRQRTKDRPRDRGDQSLSNGA